ncbi:hypothetical protein ACPOM7_24880 [Peribacillus castrilensis]|uniref:hypothetical protein n=1 Tax=Peribacillus TaxID=2675229 RepID=UPI001921CAF5|nr:MULTISPECIES: hypothetical protein [Peribacillus]MBD8590317.1 hypothetical protein [Peribacillus simplex]MCP1151623.1 hypothetical protein [Peribacillus frigoritolerans]MEA3577304.1 hypothetical protein [Peribacillus frigoritolerans]
MSLEQILVNLALTREFGANTREFGANTREFGANTREFGAFTREFGANTRETQKRTCLLPLLCVGCILNSRKSSLY